MRDSEGCTALALLILIAMLCIGIIAGEAIVHKTVVNEVQGVIVDVYNKRVGERDVYHAAIKMDTGETLVFQNHDEWVWGKWTSADYNQTLLAAKESGKRVKITLVAWRVPFLSWFQNIVAFDYAPEADE